MRLRTRFGSQRGSALILFTLMLPTLLIPLVGLGIDATMCYIVQARLGSAIDGAVLGAGRLLGTSADPEEIAGEFLNANFRTDGTAGFWGANTLTRTITYTPGITKTIAIDARVRVPLLFARIFGQNYAIVSAAGTAQRTDTRVMLVLDRSLSLQQAGMVGTMKSLSASFTQQFTEGTDELGLVVFGGSAIVGYPTGRPWTRTISSTNGGPDTSFNDGTTNSMVNQISYIVGASATGMAEALSLAYIELQKAHLRDLAGGTDGKLNAIVLFTDGAPTALTLLFNDNTTPDNVIKTSAGCTNRASTTTQIVGWIGNINYLSGNPHDGANHFVAPGLNRIMSTDTGTPTLHNWLHDDNIPNSTDMQAATPSTAIAGCSTLWTAANFSTSNSPLTKIPDHDLYGNSTNTGFHTNSHYVDASGTVTPNPIYDSVPYTGNTTAGATDSYNWGLANWDAVDDAARRIRTDANFANRAGDTERMSIAIYTIGYLGSGGLDDGLLKRVANDRSAAGYVASQPSGRYVPATDSAALSQAFAAVASEILRLTR